MRRLRLFSALSALGLAFVLVLLGLGWSTPAHALQLPVPSGTARLHTIASGQPGASWNTGGTGSGGQLSYDANTGVATLTAGLDILNWFDPNNGACPSDGGSNCAFNYDPDLSISLDASFVGITVSPILFGNTVNVTLSFETTANASPDLTVSDPTDLSFGNVLEGNWTSGFFGGNPTTGLSVSVLFDTVTGLATFDTANVSGFLAIDSATEYASLFESGSKYLGLNIASLDDFVGAGGGLDEIIAAAVSTNTLPDFTAEGNGQVFRLTSSDFVVPEPTTALLLASGLALLGSRRSRS